MAILLPEDEDWSRIIKGQFWKKLINKWISTLKKYNAGTENENDIAWWHNERASVGFLAVAAWKAKGIAIQEYWMSSKKKKMTRWGDVWIKFGKQFTLSIEAKQFDQNTAASLVKEITKAVGEANKRFLQIPRDQLGKYRACVCFLCPATKKKGFRGGLNSVNN